MYLGFFFREASNEATSENPFLVRNRKHLGPDTIHLAQAKLVNLAGSEIADGGAIADVVQVAALATGQ